MRTKSALIVTSVLKNNLRILKNKWVKLEFLQNKEINLGFSGRKIALCEHRRASEVGNGKASEAESEQRRRASLGGEVRRPQLRSVHPHLRSFGRQFQR